MSRSILILTHEFAPFTGGIASYVRETARAAAAAGHQVEVWAPGPAQEEDRHLPFTIRRLPLSGNQNWPDRFKLLSALRSAPIDWSRTTLYLPEPGPIRLWIHQGWIRLPRPKEIVLTLHGSDILRFAAWPHRRIGFRKLLAQSARIGVVSSPIRDLLLKSFPEASAKAVLVPGALPNGFNAPDQPTRSPQDPIRILTVGRIHPRKGQHLTLEALASLPPALKSRLVYQLVGPTRKPAYATKLQRIADEGGIRLEGPKTVPEAQLAACFAEADIFVLTSCPRGASIEGLGLVYLEAASCGTPVIGLDTGGVRDAIGPDNGILVSGEHPSALRDALLRLIEDPELRQKMGAAGPDWASRFSWERNVDLLFPEGSALGD